jgi:trehalose 6-phosphate phosphatase
VSLAPVDALVAALASEPARSGLCLDLDGTLAPIVSEPGAVRLPAMLGPVLADLANSLGAVAIVSGRPASFLARRARVEGVRLLGLYGLEEWRDGAVVAHPEAVRWRGAVARARARLGVLGREVAGVTIEDKGLSVAVHWRNATDRREAERAVTGLVGEVARSTGLAVAPGKLVAELRPPVGWDKGSAVRALVAGASLARVAYAGDDLGDLPAFAAARELGGWAVAVDQGSETPPGLLEAADVVLDGPPGVTAFLERLRRELDLGRGPGGVGQRS